MDTRLDYVARGAAVAGAAVGAAAATVRATRELRKWLFERSYR